jgi:voltage-gated sodium channel
MNADVSGWREHFVAIRSNKFFEMSVVTIIILSAMMIGATTYDIAPHWMNVLKGFDIAVTVFFLIELVIRMIAEKSLRDFFKKGWNIFDFLIVTASLIPIDESDLVLLARLLRIFRMLRLVSLVPEMRILMDALVKAIPRIGYVVLLMFIIFYIYGAIGSFLFEKINPVLWGDISISMLTLFRVATFEDWTDVMYETMEVFPFSWAFYLSFIFLTAFVFLNMMIGVVLDVMQEEHEIHNREEGHGTAGDITAIKVQTESMEQRMVRMEALLEQVVSRKGG